MFLLKTTVQIKKDHFTKNNIKYLSFYIEDNIPCMFGIEINVSL